MKLATVTTVNSPAFPQQVCAVTENDASSGGSGSIRIRDGINVLNFAKKIRHFIATHNERTKRAEKWTENVKRFTTSVARKRGSHKINHGRLLILPIFQQTYKIGHRKL